MSAERECARVRDLLPEVALGISTGEERAWVLDHLAGCATCRAELGELSEVADELLLLAPAREPPVGFESRVVGRLFPRRTRWRWAAAAAAALVLVAAGAGGVFLATGPDRELAASYRETLEVADGEYLSAAPLVADDARRRGHVFGYEGSPSWIVVVVRPGAEAGTYDVVATTEEGDRRAVGSMSVAHGGATWGTELPLELHDVASIVLRRGAARLVASI